MKFQVSEIRDAGFAEKEANIAPGDLIGEPPRFVSFSKPFHVKIHAQFVDPEILITGDIDSEALLICGRCLETFARTRRLHISEDYTTDAEEIDISEELRETVLLDLPLAAVCSESCRGICPSCGTNLNRNTCGCVRRESDARWGTLKSFPFK